MPELTIEVSDKTAEMFQYLAAQAGVTVKEYVENLINQTARGRAYGYYRDKLRNMTLQELFNLLGPIE